MSKQTKPLSWCWNFFKRLQEKDGKGNSVFVGYCSFCDEKYQANARRMEKHLKECKKVGAEARKEIDRLLKKTTGEPPKKIAKESDESSSRTNTLGIKSFFDKVSNDDQEEADILLTRAFTTGNIAPNFLDNPFFKQFVAKLRPSYKLPSRKYKFSKVLVPAEFDRVKKNLEEATNKADFLALSSDGWTDVRRNSLINVVVHTPKPFLFDTIDATSSEVDGEIVRTEHTGNYIASLLAEQIIKLGKHKVVAVVTDHASNMRSAWKKLAGEDTEIDPIKKYNGETFPWILFEGCKAHMLNLAARDICEKTTVADILKHCGQIAKFFGKKTPQLILEKAQLEQHGSSAILQAPVKTRWGTWAKLTSSIVANEESIKSALWAPGIQKDSTLKNEAERLRRKLCDSQDFWADVKDVEKTLIPLADAITKIEGNEVNSRRCYKLIRVAFSTARAAIEDSGFMEFIKEELLQILDNREEFGRTDVAHLLDLLEPSDREQSLSNEEKQKAIELLAKKFLKNPVFAGREGQVMTELAHWISGSGVFAAVKRGYAWDAVNTMDALTWWKAWFSDALLCKVVEMLNNVPISAAPTERNWSLRGGIHTKLRNRMKVETASQVVFIKHNLQLEYRDLFKPGKNINEEEDEEADEEAAEEDLSAELQELFMDD